VTTSTRPPGECQALVLTNLALVTEIAETDFRPKAYGIGLEWEDVIQEALLGLCVAAAKWDPEQFPQVKFEWFAGCWIRALLRQLIRKQRRYQRTHLGGDVTIVLESTGPFGAVPSLPDDVTLPVTPRVVRGRIVWAIGVVVEEPHTAKKKRPRKKQPA